MDYRIGQIIKSKAGHEKGKLFVIIKIEDEYIYIVDGISRKVSKPKKKKKKHIQIINYADEVIDRKVSNHQLTQIEDADIIKAIRLFEAENCSRIKVGGS